MQEGGLLWDLSQGRESCTTTEAPELEGQRLGKDVERTFLQSLSCGKHIQKSLVWNRPETAQKQE